MAGECSWEYNAPQFVDFATHNSEEEDVDSWFDIDHENEGINAQIEFSETSGNVEIIEDIEVIEEHPKTPENRRLTRSMCATPNNENNLPEAPDVQTGEKNPKSNNICTSLEEWRQKTANSKSVHGNSKNIKPTVNKKVEEVKTGTLKRQHRSLESNDKSVPKKRIPSTSADRSNTAANRNARALRRSVQSQKLRRTSSVGTINTSSVERVARSNIKRTNSVGKLNTSTGKANTSTGRVNLTENKTQRRSAGRVMSAERSNLHRAHSVGKLNSSTGKLDTPVTNGQRRSGGRVLSAERPYRGRSNSNTSDGGPSVKVAKLTLPTTPTCLKRKPVMKPVKPTEEKELEQIAYLRNELAKNRKLAQESYKKAVTATAYVPVQSKKEPTMPQEFHFKTDSRIKSHGMETRQGPKEKDFVSNLRHAERAKSPFQDTDVEEGYQNYVGDQMVIDLMTGTVLHHPGPVNRTTVPQPFNLTECRKRKMSDNDTESEKYVSMAQRVTAFHSQTPERFRSSKRRVQEHGNARTARSRSPGGLTVPKTPNLETKGRSRPVHVPTREELEEKELEEMRQQQFKAHPVNSKIMSNPTLGVKKVPPKPLTQFEEFNLESYRRTKERDTKQSDEEKFEFHAQPVPKKILEGVVGVKPPKEQKITVPQSPAFALKHRARLPVEVPEEEEKVSYSLRSQPAPHVGIPFQPKLSHKCTVPEPFGFEERNKYMHSKKEEKIQEILKEEQKGREFHANPLPSSSPDMLPPKNPKKATIPEPFRLEIEQRGAKKAEEWSRKLEEELHQQRAQAEFRAQNCDVVHKEPFIPAKSTRPLTEKSEFALNTDMRAVQREGFEMHKKAKEAEIEALKRQKEMRQEEEEKAAIAKLRKEMVHKPNPVKRYKGVDVQHSDKPLTLAVSPKFSTDNRLRSKVRV